MALLLWVVEAGPGRLAVRGLMLPLLLLPLPCLLVVVVVSAAVPPLQLRQKMVRLPCASVAQVEHVHDGFDFVLHRLQCLLPVLVAFNLGVELGQLAIVLVVFPLLYSVRNKSWFIPVVVRGGSVAIALVAAYWLLDRAIV